MTAHYAEKAVAAHRRRAQWIRFLALGASLALLLPVRVVPAEELRVADDAGDAVTLAAPARRIISLAPNLTEILFAIGAGQAVVGTSDYSNYPPAAARIPRIAAAGQIDLEAVLARRPDLILAWKTGNPAAQIRKLKQLGFKVYVSEPRHVLDIPSTMERLGMLTGTETQARAASARFRAHYDRLRRRYSNRQPVRVFYEIWGRPIITINAQHLISDVIRLCGGTNVFADSWGLSGQVSTEAVLARDPEVIIASAQSGRRPAWLDDWRKWPQLRAVRNDNLYFIDADLINRNGPRILQGAEQMCMDLQKVRDKQDGAAHAGVH